ncbi:MAG TPA: DUF4389 domain-containing protein [Actinoplanes sp.]|nr:DUF4389 domain-containing protein [Actinoplanes sp.]
MNTYPVRVWARPDDSPSRGLWLVKWLLLIPHYVVLLFLGVAFAVLTLAAYVAVLFTGRYPASIFDFNVGVLRWGWRVGYYGYQVLGTDRYPPFTLAEDRDYPAGLSITGPPRPPRWLPLLAWLFAVPHLIVVGALNGATWRIENDDGTTAAPLSVVAGAVLVSAVAVLFTGRRVPGLHDLLVGVARWSLRTVAYLALLTDRYPPLRLDQGPDEPDSPAPTNPSADAVPAEPTGAVPATQPAGGAAGQVIALVAGVLLIFVAAGLVGSGTAVLALDGRRDATGAVSGPALAVSTPTAAITVEHLRVTDSWVWTASGWGDVRVSATGTAGTELFLGIGRQSDVDRWLAGAAHDQLIEAYTSDNARYRRSGGTIRAVAPPADQGFWVNHSTGTGQAVLDWDLGDGEYAVVLANANGTPGVAATATVATRIPRLAPLGRGLIGGGLPVALAAFALIWIGAAGMGRRHAQPPHRSANYQEPPAKVDPDRNS